MRAPQASPLNKDGEVEAPVAAATFKAICQFMGITAKAGKATVGAVELLSQICAPALGSKAMRAEVFCQAMKQLTENPVKASRARGVIMLTVMLGCLKVPEEILEVLQRFIAEGPKGWVDFSIQAIRRTQASSARLQPPCAYELRIAKQKSVVRVPVLVDMVEGRNHKARLDGASRMMEWVEEIAAAEGIKSTEGWSVFIERAGHLESLRGASQAGTVVMDTVSKLDIKGLTGVSFFTFRKEIFSKDVSYTEDPVETQLIYNQLCFNLACARLVPKKKDDYTMLAALIYYCEHGHDVDQAAMEACTTRYLPDSFLSSVPLKKFYKGLEKEHAKADYSRKSYGKTQAQAVLIRYTLDNLSRAEGFSAGGYALNFVQQDAKTALAALKDWQKDMIPGSRAGGGKK